MYTELSHKRLLENTKGEQGFYDNSAKELQINEEVGIIIFHFKLLETYIKLQTSNSSLYSAFFLCTRVY